MLTRSYTESTPDDHIHFGWKAFPFGVYDELKGKWLASNAGPGFHVFLSKLSADAYVAGTGFGEVHPVHFRGIIRKGFENHHPAFTAKELFILSNEVSTSHV